MNTNAPSSPTLIIPRHLKLTLVAFAGFGVLADQLLKGFAADVHAGGARAQRFWDGAVTWTYAENKGAFLGVLKDLPEAWRFWLLGIGTVLIAAGLLWGAIRSQTPAMRWAFLLMAAGGAGNAVDRLLRGSVIDFVVVEVGPLRTGVFNLADVFIMAGAGLALWMAVRPERRARPQASLGEER